MIGSNKIILQSLSVNNFATFKHQVIDFSEGFNGIIGETGSGKSLVLDALQFILGQRADKKFIRKNADHCIIEATYLPSGNDIKSYFNEIGFPFADEINVKRIIYSTGKSKCFLNHQSCTLQTLQDIAKRFIDLVGQFENQKLLSEKYQLILLDKFCDFSDNLNRYQNEFLKLQEFQSILEDLTSLRDKDISRLDFIEYQLNEISKLNPSIEDEENLISQKQRLSRSQELETSRNRALQLLSDGDRNTLELLNQIKSHIASDLFPHSYQESANEAYEILQDLSFQISSFNIEDNEEISLDDILHKLDMYQKLKRKFGGTTESLIEHADKLQTEFQNLKDIDSKILEATEELSAQKALCHQLANKLHLTRITIAKKLSQELTESVQKLNMNEAEIILEIKELPELNSFGITQVELVAQTNIGEGFYRVKDIASGGELSRILLAFRKVLSAKDSISIFLFDEIDTGIGGETASKIGDILKEVSLSSQVVAITHLPQIAIKTDKLISVSKKIDDSGKRTESQIEIITGKSIQAMAKEMVSL